MTDKQLYTSLSERQNFLYKELQDIDRNIKNISKKYPKCCVCYSPVFDFNKASLQDEKKGSDLDLWHLPKEGEFYCNCIKDGPETGLNI